MHGQYFLSSVLGDGGERGKNRATQLTASHPPNKEKRDNEKRAFLKRQYRIYIIKPLFNQVLNNRKAICFTHEWCS